jgi:hypothetical protein
MPLPPQSDHCHCPRLSVWKAQLKRSYEDRRSRPEIIVLSWRAHLLPSFLGVASPYIKWSTQALDSQGRHPAYTDVVTQGIGADGYAKVYARAQQIEDAVARGDDAALQQFVQMTRNR